MCDAGGEPRLVAAFDDGVYGSIVSVRGGTAYITDGTVVRSVPVG
jgi:hypothetical protein